MVNHYYLPLWEKRNPDSFAKLNRVVFAEKENSENFVYFGVAKNSKNKKAAQQFISWLLSDAGQKTYTNLSKLIPLKKTAENSNQTEK